LLATLHSVPLKQVIAEAMQIYLASAKGEHL